MSDTLLVELVTPEKLFYTGQATMVEAPGVEGDFGVLPNHAPLMSLLREGAVTIHADGTTRQFNVTGGLAEVNEKGVVILAEAAEAL